MPGFLLRMAITALALFIASAVVPGVTIQGNATLLAAAFLLGVVNAVVRPIALFLTFPLSVVTLGLFVFVINAAMLALVARLLPGFMVASFSSALLGSFVVSVVGAVVSWTIGPSGHYERLALAARH